MSLRNLEPDEMLLLREEPKLQSLFSFRVFFFFLAWLFWGRCTFWGLLKRKKRLDFWIEQGQGYSKVKCLNSSSNSRDFQSPKLQRRQTVLLLLHPTFLRSTTTLTMILKTSKSMNRRQARLVHLLILARTGMRVLLLLRHTHDMRSFLFHITRA